MWRKNKMIINRLTDKQRVDKLEDKGFTWFEIADLLSKSYEEVRSLAEEGEVE